MGKKRKRNSLGINGKNGWALLGDRKVNHFSEKDVFNVRNRNRFTAIRLYVEESDIEIKVLEIMLINGDILKPSIAFLLRLTDAITVDAG